MFKDSLYILFDQINITMTTHRFSYPVCNIEGHASEPLSRLCIDEKCHNKSVVCCICEYDEHKGHQTIPVKHFIKQIASGDNENALKYLQYAKSLHFMKEEFFSLISKCRNSTLKQLQSLETRGKIYFNRCEETFLQLTTLSNYKSILGGDEQPSIKAYKVYFKKVLDLYSNNDKNGFSLKSKYEAFFDDCKSKEKKLNQIIQAINKDLSKAIQKSEEYLQTSHDINWKSNILTWSETLKGLKIKIEGNKAEQTGMQSSGQRFGLMEQSLSLAHKTRWGIKVKKFVGWVGVGICLKNSIHGANYHFSYTNIGHGSYLISTNGYSWSHSVKDFNSAFKTFQFTVNDIVYIEYDPKQGKLRFQKNTSADKFELDIQAPPSGDNYHPCVNLCSTGDAVELVFPGIALS